MESLVALDTLEKRKIGCPYVGSYKFQSCSPQCICCTD